MDVASRATACCIALATTACGRMRFDELPVDGNLALTCTAPVIGGCDDGDPCTVDDVCAYSQCGPGRFDSASACTARPTSIYRSVGPTVTAALASAAVGPMTIIGATVAFAAPLPDRVGVGDVIEYDVNADGVLDQLAVVSRRFSSRVFEVHSVTGADPAPVDAATNWELHRAYTSLNDALVTGAENPLIDASLRNFDTWTDGADLVAGNQIWAVACYADGVDTFHAYVCSSDETRAVFGCALARGWRTGPANYLRVFTPVAASDVGVTQRHSGRWGDGYRRTSGMEIYPSYLRIEGLAQRIDLATMERSIIVYSTGLPGEVLITNTLTWMANAAGLSRNFDVWSQGLTGPGLVRVVYANDIAISQSTADPAGAFYINSTQALAEIYSSTAVVVAGPAFTTTNNDVATCRNCLGIGTGTGVGFGGVRWRSITNSVSTDGTVTTTAAAALDGDASTAYGSRVVNFVDQSNHDFHLAIGDSGARGAGANMSADSLFPFDDDIDGDQRPAIPAAWDVGADQSP